ncbi:MAG: hypothetical protein M9920_05040 [Verrucomicrobiae bacterium]|nr:hypothetical protein [Verrucomicrobiae bacterium]
MKKGFLALAMGAALLALAGCVNTVSEQKTAGVKLSRDRVENHYEVPFNQALEAAKAALKGYGALSRETTLLESTNQVRALEGMANGRSVWVRVEALEPRLTSVIVQARGTWAGSDVQTAHELATRIALELSK